MGRDGMPWNTVKHHGIVKNIMEYHGTDYHGISQNIMEYRSVPWNIVQNQGGKYHEYHGTSETMIIDLSVHLWRPRAVGWLLDTSGMAEKQSGMTGV